MIPRLACRAKRRISGRFIVWLLLLASLRSAHAQVAPIAWRTIDTWAANGLTVDVQVSTARRVRLVSAFANSAATTSPELSADSLSAWLTDAKSALAHSSKRDLVVPDAILISPYPSVPDFKAYSVTLSDTSGKWIATRATPGDIALFASDLEEASLAAKLFTAEELRRSSPIQRTDAVVDSDRPLEYPNNVCLEGDGVVQLTFQVDSAGKVDPKFDRVDLATDESFARVAEYNVVRMHFRPATIEGHKIESSVTHTFRMHPPPANAVTIAPSDQLAVRRVPTDQLRGLQTAGCYAH